eukprot:CAMPEP_0185424614 /NCGR_PEP_ID=MMETSP1365-20130426/13348_1 /TAXON_ID=38817 /ORGANISM="Gephyrocapsa oceanica, Strain RCC1303" /LENGTH=165 /DNA_ID=CAMNT_0028028551 /DNA_START=64 /DNA_END=558 /DNA_ORIENTATION=-
MALDLGGSEGLADGPSGEPRTGAGFSPRREPGGAEEEDGPLSLHRGSVAPQRPRRQVQIPDLQLAERRREAVVPPRLRRLRGEELDGLEVEQRVDDHVLRPLACPIHLAALAHAHRCQGDRVPRVECRAADDAQRDGGHADLCEDGRREDQLEQRRRDGEGCHLA